MWAAVSTRKMFTSAATVLGRATLVKTLTKPKRPCLILVPSPGTFSESEESKLQCQA